MQSLFLFLVLLGGNLFANDNLGDFFNFNMYGRIRGEQFDNFGFSSERGEYAYTGSKFRLNIESGKSISNKWKLVVTPQFVKYFGVPELVPTSTSTNTSFPTSGSVFDTRFDIHQALIDYFPVESFEIKLGRQIISYGDQLLISALEWNNVGRVFDALRFNYFYNAGHTDFFISSLIDQVLYSEGPSDFYFTGLYSSNDFGDFFKNTDFYLIYKRDEILKSNLAYAGALGTRVKSKEGRLDHRVEVTLENVENNSDKFNGQYQFDIEVGYELNSISTRFSLEYFQSSKMFDQFFPLVHGYLGFADQFGRRNIKGMVVGARPKFSDTIRARLDFHIFRRTDNTQPIYLLNGKTPYDPTGGSDSYDVAKEVDLVFYWDLDPGINLEVGISYVNPGSYMDSLKDQSGNFRNQDVAFGYLALETKF